MNLLSWLKVSPYPSYDGWSESHLTSYATAPPRSCVSLSSYPQSLSMWLKWTFKMERKPVLISWEHFSTATIQADFVVERLDSVGGFQQTLVFNRSPPFETGPLIRQQNTMSIPQIPPTPELPEPDKTGSVEVNGFPMHYEVYGTGPRVLLLIPGAMGTGQTDFAHQIAGPTAFDLKRYTLVCVSLPGWGKCRPPARPYGLDVYDNDTKCVAGVMEVGILCTFKGLKSKTISFKSSTLSTVTIAFSAGPTEPKWPLFWQSTIPAVCSPSSYWAYSFTAPATIWRPLSKHKTLLFGILP